MLAEESAGKKLGFSDLLNKNGGSKTLISVDGKVSVYFEKRTGDDVRFICRIIRKGPQDIIKKSKSLNLIVTEVKKYFPSFPDFEKPKDIPFVPEGMDVNSFFRLEYMARIYNVTPKSYAIGYWNIIFPLRSFPILQLKSLWKSTKGTG